jgi:hypothetical protein
MYDANDMWVGAEGAGVRSGTTGGGVPWQDSFLEPLGTKLGWNPVYEGVTNPLAPGMSTSLAPGYDYSMDASAGSTTTPTVQSAPVSTAQMKQEQMALAVQQQQAQQAAIQQALAEDAARNTQSARSIMASRDFQEGGGYDALSPQEQAIMDQYREDEASGRLRGLLGDIQGYDEGGYTGGDFSSGEGWE